MPYSVSDFVLERLENVGVKHVFGIAGDYILPFFPKMEESKKLDLICNADEAGSGFAADGYARLHGIGCVVATYNVGALKLCNPIAGAYAEKSPVIVISGAPGVDERQFHMHHMTDNFRCQQEVFEKITCDQAILDNPNTAGYEVDRCLESLKYYKQPIYIEIPRDVAKKVITYDVYEQGTPIAPKTDEHNLEDALQEVSDWIKSAESPVILAGVEVARCKLGTDLVKFAEKNNIPIAATLLSKSVIKETHPLYAGVYAGTNSSQPQVKDLVENSDCLLVCGEVITEATTGYRPSKVFEKRKMITATIGELKVSNHHYPHVGFVDFCNVLFKQKLREFKVEKLPKKKIEGFKAEPDTPLTTIRLFNKINSMLAKNNFVVADAGDSLLGASDMIMAEANTFLGPCLYLSMGFAIPAALGANIAAGEDSRAIVVVGDGAFQMSCSEISTMLKYNLRPIIFVLNNRGYTTERFIMEGEFNNIVDWHYEKFTNLIGGGIGMRAETEDELEFAVDMALKENDLTIINCIVDSHDASPALNRICDVLSKKAR